MWFMSDPKMTGQTKNPYFKPCISAFLQSQWSPNVLGLYSRVRASHLLRHMTIWLHGHVKSLDKLKMSYHFPQSLWPPNLAGWSLTLRASIYQITWPFDNLFTWMLYQFSTKAMTSNLAMMMAYHKELLLIKSHKTLISCWLTSDVWWCVELKTHQFKWFLTN